MRVLKFGGTSVADAGRFMTVAGIAVAAARETGVALVLSAPAGITNLLVALAAAGAALAADTTPAEAFAEAGRRDGEGRSRT